MICQKRKSRVKFKYHCGMKRIFVFVLLVVIFLSSFTFANGKTVRIGTLSDFPPYCYGIEGSRAVAVETIAPGSDSKVLQGYSWDVVRESFHRQGYTIQLYIVPWMRGLHYLGTGKIDVVFPAGKTVEREAVYDFSRETVDTVEITIYMRDPDMSGWHGLDGLSGMNVSYVRGWAYGKKWEANHQINKIEADTIQQSFEMLANGRVDAVVGYALPYDYVLRHTTISEKIGKVGSFDLVNEFLIAVKGKNGAIEMLDAFDRGKRSLIHDLELSRIQKRWQSK